MPQKPLSILISGAGIAGCSLALMEARQSGLNPRPVITLIERSSKPRTTGQAIDIRGPAVSVIKKLGLEEKIKVCHTTERGLTVVGTKGETIAQFNASGDSAKQSATSEYEILRGELAGLIVYGESIKRMEERDDGVEVEFANGLETRKYDVVVAADGYSSSTRAMMFEEFAAEDCVKPLGMYIAFFSIPRIPEDDDYWRWYNAPGGLVVHIRPHRTKETVGVYLSITNSKQERVPDLEEILSQGVAAQKAFLRNRISGVGWQTERLLDAMDKSQDFYMQHSTMIRTPRWTKGRCALVGDAAYAMMGMGTSLAIIGAYLLAGELAQAQKKGSSATEALQKYEKVLRPLVDKYSVMPPGVPQLANPQTKIGIGLLHAVIRAASWMRLDKLVQGLGGAKEEDWKLPEYDCFHLQTTANLTDHDSSGNDKR